MQIFIMAQANFYNGSGLNLLAPMCNEAKGWEQQTLILENTPESFYPSHCNQLVLSQQLQTGLEPFQ